MKIKMSKFSRLCFWIILVLFFFSKEGYPQNNENSSSKGFILGFGIAYGNEMFSVANQKNSEKHLIQQVRLGISKDQRTFLLFEFEIHPFDMENPLRLESYRGKFYLFSLQIYPYGNFYVRGGFGIHSRKWSGLDPVTDSDSGGAIGLSLGYELKYKKNYALVAELIYRSASIEAEGSVKSNFLGFMLSGCYYLKR